MNFAKIYQRIISGLVLSVFFLAQVASVPIIYAANKGFFASVLDTFDFEIFNKEKIEYNDIVAILVPKALYDLSHSFDGLRENDDFKKYLSSKTIKQRIDRYAETIQKKLPQTKALIIQIEEEQNPSDISAVLEKLYLEGEREDFEFATLTGIVIVSNFPTEEDKSLSTPLPIVNKNGNSFLSIYPYVDFDDKAYIYNQVSDNFEYLGSDHQMQAEIWHGVIMPPVGGEEGLNLLAEYLDKNYLYHSGIEQYSDFDKKLFYHDQFRLEESTNNFLFKNYSSYTDSWEEIGFMQYTKELVKALNEKRGVVFELFDGLDNDGDLVVDEEVENGLDDDGDGLIDEDIGSTNQLDDDGDGVLNEDGPELEFDDRDHDDQADEDPYGDFNGDGCVGVCNTDDDADGKDVDGDGLPSELERQYGWDPLNKKSPFPLAKIFIRDWTEAEFIDEQPSAFDSNCLDEQRVYHPEWDDDEDGACDEDTGQVHPITGCHDNDNDCDGLINEDGGNEKEEEKNEIDMLPDIFSKKVSEKFFSKYYEIYKKLVGDINDLVAYTGRYKVNFTNDQGYKDSDFDTIIQLITKKDEIVLNFLTGLNLQLEANIDTAVRTKLQQDIPLLHKVVLSGSVDASAFMDVEFINHGVEDKDDHTFATPYMLGVAMDMIRSADQCSLYLGDISEAGEGKIIEANRVYDPISYEPYKKDIDDDGFKGKEFAGCNGEFYEYPEFCFAVAAIAPVFDRANGRRIEQKTAIENEASYRDCFDFKYGINFWGDSKLSNKDYLTFAKEVVKDIDKLLNEEKEADYTEEDLEADMQGIVNGYVADGKYQYEYTPYNKSYLIIDDKKAPIIYFIKGIGLDPNNYEEVNEELFAFGKNVYLIEDLMPENAVDFSCFAYGYF